MTAILTHEGQTDGLPYKKIVDGELWTRVTQAYVREYGTTLEFAERAMNEAFAFLRFSVENPGFGPSAEVDRAWRILLSYPRRVQEVCRIHFGGVVHHEPAGKPGVDYTTMPTVGDTVKAMREANLPIDPELWTNLSSQADCFGRGDSVTGGDDDNDGNEAEAA